MKELTTRNGLPSLWLLSIVAAPLSTQGPFGLRGSDLTALGQG
jgi:hypothetical protein